MSKFRNPNDYYEQKDNRKGLLLSVVLHFLLVGGVIVSVLNKEDSAAGPIQLELWTEGTQQIIAPPAETRTLDPANEDTRTNDEVSPEPIAAPDHAVVEPTISEEAKTPAPQVPSPIATPVTSEENPEIALEKKRQQEIKAEQEAKAKAEQAAKEKAEQEAKAKAEQAAKEKAEQEAKAKAEQAAKEKAEQEAKAKAEQAAKEKAIKAKIDAQLAKEAKTKANTKGDALRAAMRGDINSIAGIKGGINNRNQIGGGGGTDGYARLVKACVEPRLRFSSNQRLKVRYKVEFDNTYQVTHAKITRTSGNKAFDNAALNALKQCNPFPKPPSGNKVVEGYYEFRPQ